MKTDVEMRKCEVMRKAAYSRDIRPAFMCVQSDDCIKSVSIDDFLASLRSNTKEAIEIHVFRCVAMRVMQQLLALKIRRWLGKVN